MFFKRLELQGFKSFGHKTTIDFQKGFTIVVGPNGCGKSNVLDSIRWVLGTQSAKSLRGEKMGDVVFRGSQSTRPAGLASATLTCCNEAGHLKVDESEVEITRRLFINGESEYKINKKNARMRDIQELFMDTGLGADGYSIIEQNQIGQMVAAKPRERRDVFEEAAGISRYKARREEALRKLIRTSEDLVRLDDLVREIERQCNTLRNQARKALRFRRTARRLRRLQQRLFVMRHTDVTEKVTASQQRFTAAQNAFEQASANCSSAEAKSVKLQEQIDQAKSSLQEFQQAQFQLRTNRDAEKHRIQLIQNKLKSIADRLESIGKEWQSRQSRLTVLKSTLESLETEFAQDKVKHGEGNAELQRDSEALAQLKNRSATATHQVAEKQTKLRQLQARERTLENDLRVSTSLVERLEKDLAGTNEALAQMQEKLTQVEQAFETARVNREDALSKLEALREEAKTIKAQIESDDSAKKELNQEIEVLARELSKTSSRLHALQELEDSFAGYFQGVKEVMTAQDKGQLKGMIGIVSTLIEVPSNLEVAVEVALGGDVQDIVTYTVEDAKRAIQFLKDRKLGRATFLPLDNLHTDFPLRHLEGIWNKPGVLGLGKDLVKYNPVVENAVTYLFGNTVFVEELDVAIALSRDGVRNRFVSLKGDVANPRGVLSGGSHQSRGLLTRQREIRQLQTEGAELEQKLQAQQSKMAAMKDRLSQLYARSAELQSLRHQTEIALANYQKDYDQAERERRERRNQAAQSDARRTQQTVDLQKQQEIAERSAAGMQELKDKIEAADAEVQKTEQENASLLEEFRLLSERVAVLREQQNRGAQSLNVTQKRLDEMKASMGEAQDDNETRRREQEQLEAEQQQGLVDLEDAENAFQDVLQEVEIAEQRVAARQQENEVLQQEIKVHQNQTQHLFRDRQEKDNQFREAQVQAAELKAQLEYLEREVEDEFALTIEDVRRELLEEEQEERERLAAQEKAKAEAKEAAAKEKAQAVAQAATVQAALKVAATEQQALSTEEGEGVAAEQQEGLEQPVDSHSEKGIAASADAVLQSSATTEPTVEPVAPDEPEENAVAVSGADLLDKDDDLSAAEFNLKDDGPVTTSEDDEADSPAKLRHIVNELRQKIQRMGSVNEEAIEEYQTQNERFTFLSSQRKDVLDAKTQLEESIAQIDATTTKMFHEALDEIRVNFQTMYKKLFNGGEADLILVEDEKHPEPGIDIYAQPPGKKIGGSITLLSGGEKALTAIALMFALFQYSPSPICILDEIDAPLDDVNCARMCAVLKQHAENTQFLIITHNKITMGLADTIYGVTMQEAGVSKVVSVKFEDVEESGLLETTEA